MASPTSSGPLSLQDAVQSTDPWPPRPNDQSLTTLDDTWLRSVAWGVLRSCLRSEGVSTHWAKKATQTILVYPRPVAERWAGEAHLLVLEPDAPSTPTTSELELNTWRAPSPALQALRRWLSDRRHALTVLHAEGKGHESRMRASREALDAIERRQRAIFHWLQSCQLPQFTTVRLPAMQLLSAPTPHWAVAGRKRQLTGTVGVVASRHGQKGITCSLHVIQQSQTTQLAEGKLVLIAAGSQTLRGIVRRASAIADTCFVELRDPWPSHLVVRGRGGVLSKTGPPPNLQVEFEGYGSGKPVGTQITGQDWGVPQPTPGTQLRIYTGAAASDGDSGAALIDPAADQVLGFAFQTTRPGSALTYSSWIWGATVYDELSLL